MIILAQRQPKINLIVNCLQNLIRKITINISKLMRTEQIVLCSASRNKQKPTGQQPTGDD